MKKVVFFVLLVQLVLFISAETMIIHLSDGTTDEIEITSDVNITFADVSEGDIMKVLKMDNSIDEYSLTDVVVISFGEVGIDVDDVIKLKEFSISLLTNYPNPFNPSTKISFNIEKSGLVTVAIYNQKGEFIKELMKENLTAGNYNVNWESNNNSAQSVSSGYYFTKVTLDDEIKVKSMLLLK